MMDANVLIYAYDSGSEKHDAARLFLEQALSNEDSVGIPWISILAFLRIGTDKRLYERPRTMAQSSAIVESWIELDNVATIAPGPKHWKIFAKMLVDGQAVSRHTSDAHVAAMAIEYGATLVTFDRDFARYPGLRSRWLK